MISRVAELCMWMSRYLERTEDTARVLDVNRTLLLDYHVPLEEQWRPLLIISGIHDDPCPLDAESVQHYMTWDASHLGSITSTLGAARENARIIREIISAEMWERINYYFLWLKSPNAHNLYNSNRSEFYAEIRRINQIVHGIGDGTMSHDEPWEFFLLGKYLERANQVARIIDVKYHILLPRPEEVGTPIDQVQWMAILTSCSGYEPFHRKVRTTNDTGAAVAEFLILDPEFPRSVLHCLTESRKAAYAISGRTGDEPASEVESLLDELVEWLSSKTITELIQEGLHESLTKVVNRIHNIGDAIYGTYFDAPVHLIHERTST